MKPRGTPAFDRAITSLRAALTDPDLYPPGSRLPATAVLARKAGVSLVTMSLAIRSVAPEFGLLLAPGAGIRRGAPVAVPEDPSVLRSHRVQTGIMRDIVDGRYTQAGRLPILKELALRHSCGFRVLRRAISALVEQGMLAGNRRDLLMRQTTPTRPGSSVTLLVGDGFHDLIYSTAYRSRVEIFTAVLEQECARRNLALERIVVRDTTRALVIQPQSLGTLIYLSAGLYPLRKDLIAKLLLHGKPIAAFNDASHDAFAGTVPALLGACDLDDERAGFDTGRELLCLGHRTVCFVGLAEADFSDLRLRGLRRAYASADLGDAIHALNIPNRPGAPQPSEGVLTSDDHAELDVIHQYIGSWMSLLDQSRTMPLPPDHRHTALENLTQFLSIASYRKDVVPPMRSALNIPGLSAIVAADDNIALHGVMPFMQRAKLRVPQDLSIVSFNGSFEASQAGLSSYQFDIAGMVMRMLDWVIAPQRGRPVAQGRRFPVNGVLIRRPSLGTSSRPG